MTIRVHLVNFGYDVYAGNSMEEARKAAKRTGFESVVIQDGVAVATYSPIGGWR